MTARRWPEVGFQQVVMGRFWLNGLLGLPMLMMMMTPKGDIFLVGGFSFVVLAKFNSLGS
jgi:hypothetical protein